ncbi:nucleoside-diphosphate kinase, partial [Candidatus Woesebacteria bacterium]|nr:nucleoside-diphosphate kinase [Candidatus Woesebacteria bacterium]
MTEQTVVLIKPDGVKRGLIGNILGRFERVGLKHEASKINWVDNTIVGKPNKDEEDYH